MCSAPDINISLHKLSRPGTLREFPSTPKCHPGKHYHIEAETKGRHFPDDIFKCTFLNENVLISIKISLKFVPKGQINNIPALV